MVESTPKGKPALSKPLFITMARLEPGTRVNMHLRVHSVQVTRQRRRYDGGELNQVAECLVGDEHGCVKLVAHDDQLQVVRAGAVVTLRNAHANVVKEHLRLEVDRWAKVEASGEAVGRVNTENNKSEIEFELVSVPV